MVNDLNQKNLHIKTIFFFFFFLFFLQNQKNPIFGVFFGHYAQNEIFQE